MTTLNQARESVYSRFVAQWGTTTPIAFENEKFDEPTDVPWVRLTVRSASRKQETLGRPGNRKFRSAGLVLVQVYTRTDVGVKQGDDLAEQAKNVFEAVSFDGLDFEDGLARETGSAGRWYQHLVEVRFDFEEIK